MSKEAMNLALEALKFALHVGFDESSESQIKKGDKAVQQHQNAITALREALAEQPAQEPVGEVLDERGAVDWISFVPPAGKKAQTRTALHTAAPVAASGGLSNE